MFRKVERFDISNEGSARDVSTPLTLPGRISPFWVLYRTTLVLSCTGCGMNRTTICDPLDCGCKPKWGMDLPLSVSNHEPPQLAGPLGSRVWLSASRRTKRQENKTRMVQRFPFSKLGSRGPLWVCLCAARRAGADRVFDSRARSWERWGSGGRRRLRRHSPHCARHASPARGSAQAHGVDGSLRQHLALRGHKRHHDDAFGGGRCGTERGEDPWNY